MERQRALLRDVGAGDAEDSSGVRRANPHLPSAGISPDLIGAAGDNADALIIDQALTSWQTSTRAKARIAEMKFFGDLTAEQIADVLSVSVQTVNRDWSLARAWLRREISGVSAGAKASSAPAE